MFTDFGAFFASIQDAWDVDQAKANAYYVWYLSARAQNKIVLGREKDLESLKKEYGLAEEGGSMLIGVKTWDIMVNDSWILGGIHAQSPFLLKTVLTFDSVYNVKGWQELNAAQKQKKEPPPIDKTRVMFVTTREIAGLNLFGYRKNTENADGQLFLCEDKNAARDANFQDYRMHTQAVAAAALS
jgi:hypothetical protein